MSLCVTGSIRSLPQPKASQPFKQFLWVFLPPCRCDHVWLPLLIAQDKLGSAAVTNASSAACKNAGFFLTWFCPWGSAVAQLHVLPTLDWALPVTVHQKRGNMVNSILGVPLLSLIKAWTASGFHTMEVSGSSTRRVTGNIHSTARHVSVLFSSLHPIWGANPPTLSLWDGFFKRRRAVFL